MKYFNENAFGSYVLLIDNKIKAEIVEDAIDYYEKHQMKEIQKKWLAFKETSNVQV